MVVSASRVARTAAPVLRSRRVRPRWSQDHRRTWEVSGRLERRRELRGAWQRFSDDGELVRLKLALLAGLLVLAALLERTV